MKQIKKINWLKIAEVLFAIVLVFAPVAFASAQLQGTRDQFCVGTGLNCSAGTSVNSLIKTVINWALAVTFAIAVLFMIYGGFLYITAGGNEENADKGKKTIFNALIGIIVIVLSYVIVNVVANFVSQSGTGGSDGGLS